MYGGRVGGLLCALPFTIKHHLNTLAKSVSLLRAASTLWPTTLFLIPPQFRVMSMYNISVIFLNIVVLDIDVWLQHVCWIQRIINLSCTGDDATVTMNMSVNTYSTCNRNEYQVCLLRGKGSRCVGLTTLPPSCSDCKEILGASTFWSTWGAVQACNGIAVHWHVGSSESV